MPTFSTNIALSTAQTLNGGEVGLIGQNGALLVTAASAVTVGSSGRLTVLGGIVSGTAAGVTLSNLSGGGVTIGGSGSVIGSGVAGAGGAGISGNLIGSSTLRNAGEIIGSYGINLSNSSASATLNIVNSGLIEGGSPDPTAGLAVSMLAGARLRLDNSGTIHTSGPGPGISLTGTGNAYIANSGTISTGAENPYALKSTVFANLVNTGQILGKVDIQGQALIASSGVIIGDIILGVSSDQVRITGLVDGFVSMGNGNNSFVLDGGRVTGVVSGGTGSDSYEIDRSDIEISDAGGGDVVYSWVNYAISDGIERLQLLGPNGLAGTGNGLDNSIGGTLGNDTLRGEGGADVLTGLDGDNLLIGGFGNDAIVGGGGDDVMRGGAGNDRLDVTAGQDIYIGGTGTDQLTLFNLAAFDAIVVNLATGKVQLDGDNISTVAGIEHVRASVGNDSVSGDAGANLLEGGDGADTLAGAVGADTLVGGRGADQMIGGAGADVFLYRFVAESRLADGVDLIQQFQVGTDDIDLSGIDAALGGADDAFVFIGEAAFSGTGAQVRAVRDSGSGTTTVEVLLANSSVPDMTIVLQGLVTLATTDFSL